EQHGGGADAALHAGDDEVIEDRTPLGVGQERQRDQDQGHRDKNEQRLLPAAEAAARGDRDQEEPGDGYRDVRAHAEVPERERDADELGDGGQEVEQEQVTDAEPA